MITYNSSKVINAVLTAVLLATASFGGAIATSSTAGAMTLNNCTSKSLYIRMRGQNTKKMEYSNKDLRPGQRTQADMSRSQKYQIVIGAGNSRKTFSGWKATEELSFRTIAGNTEISRGNFCKQAVKKKPDSRNNRAKHLAFCMGRYGDNYDPEYNEVFLADGGVKECKSPFS